MRFTTRGLLITTTVFALVFGLLFLAPRWIATPLYGLTSTAIYASLIAGAVILKGEMRVFCLAGLLPIIQIQQGGYSSNWVMALAREFRVLSFSSFTPGLQAVILVLIQLVNCTVCGLVGLLAARMIARRSD